MTEETTMPASAPADTATTMRAEQTPAQETYYEQPPELNRIARLAYVGSLS
jgi:hypothetical protein